MTNKWEQINLWSFERYEWTIFPVDSFKYEKEKGYIKYELPAKKKKTGKYYKIKIIHIL